MFRRYSSGNEIDENNRTNLSHVEKITCGGRCCQVAECNLNSNSLNNSDSGIAVSPLNVRSSNASDSSSQLKRSPCHIDAKTKKHLNTSDPVSYSTKGHVFSPNVSNLVPGAFSSKNFASYTVTQTRKFVQCLASPQELMNSLKCKKPKFGGKDIYPASSSQCDGGEGLKCDLSPIERFLQTVWDSSSQFLSCESRIDYGSLDDDKIIPMFLGSHVCYDAMPKSGKVILLSTDLLVKNAFSCLVTNEIRAAPLWDSTSRSFVGMLTISDFINVLRHYYYSSREDIKDIENQKILTWRKITQVEKPFIKIGPNESLAQATKLLIHEGVHRLPVYEERRNSVLFLITRRRLLQYLYNNLIDKFGKTNAKTPLFFKKTIGELKLGTLENIAKITLRSNVIEALDLFVERNVSALPVVDDDGLLVDIFAKFDVFALAKEQTYHNLDMSISEALDKASVHEDGYVCTLDETLGTVIERFFVLKVHRLVVVDGKHTVIGMLSLSDILKFLVLQPLAGLGDTDLAVSDTIEETPEGAVGGADSDTSVFFGAEKEETSSDLAEDLIKLQIGDDADAPASEDPHE